MEIEECFKERVKEGKPCHREFNGYELCDGCPRKILFKEYLEKRKELFQKYRENFDKEKFDKELKDLEEEQNKNWRSDLDEIHNQ